MRKENNNEKIVTFRISKTTHRKLFNIRKKLGMNSEKFYASIFEAFVKWVDENQVDLEGLEVKIK